MAITIQPPGIIDLLSIRFGSILFLAGPIQGALSWRGEAVPILVRLLAGDFLIANPQSSMWQGVTDEEERRRLFGIQVDWEHFYLSLSLRCGIVVFYLAEEEEHNCDRAFAQTSRFELGTVLRSALALQAACLETIPLPLVVGIHPAFSNRHYLRRTLNKNGIGEIPTTIEETMHLATERLKEMQRTPKFAR